MEKNFKYVVPPGLKYKVKEFIAHYQAAQGYPIIICGPSGVGKSLFIHLFKKLYRKDNGNNAPILEINCAHFEGDVARSELFGHEKGAFTHAIQTKEGWLKKANKGVLILEEVGELPLPTQAKLLTFIETGEFHKVGSTKIEKAKVQIVAATNNEEALRKDFFYRFFPFYVPPLYQRREDILYYLAFNSISTLKELMPWEVLILLSYNWPGNVREIERVVKLIQRHKIVQKDISFKFWTEALKFLETHWKELNLDIKILEEMIKSGLSFIDKRTSDIRAYKVHSLYLDLKNSGVDVNILQKILKTFGLSLSIYDKEKIFKDLNNFTEFLEYNPELDVYFVKKIKIFSKVYKGFKKFCYLFGQSEKMDKNILDSLREEIEGSNATTIKYTHSVEKLLIKEIKTWQRKYREEHILQKKEIIWSNYTKDALLKRYYQELLKVTKGNQKEASKLAGMNYSTFRDHLKKYGLL